MKPKKKHKRSAKWMITVCLALLIILILVYNPVSVRVMTVGVAVYYGLDPGIFYRLIRSESSFRSFAISNAEAIGLGQLRESTAFYIHKNHKRGLLFVPFYNLKLAAKYVLYLRGRYNGNWSLTLAAYNWGETNVSKRISGMKIEPDKNYQYRFKDIPETYKYIDKILSPKNKA
ncbi:MAG: transglycosylase SLT domain-containing protein [Candidatus Cloacimonas sp.]|nr:transglycosylase SLT domain-containing protein [Candidatus Cloacimonas sp.]